MTQAETPTLRAFALLERLIHAGAPLSLAELARDSGIPKASLHRMLVALERGGLIMREPGARLAYAVGPRLAHLGLRVVLHPGPRRQRHAILAALVAELEQTCNLTMLHDDAVLYLERVEADWPLRLQLQPGSRIPAHCCASGKLLLAMLPRDERSALAHAMTLARRTANTITDPGLLESELDRIAHSGVALDNEEFVDGIACVAVPVLDPDGACVAALAMHAPVSRMPLSRALDQVPRLQRAARALAPTFSLPG